MPRTKRKLTIPEQTVNEEVLEIVSLELAISKHLVKEVVQVQSDYTAARIREGGFDGVMWPLFGKIKVRPSKVYKYHVDLGGSEVRKNTEINK